MDLRERYSRTVCDCEACCALCEACPGMLVPGDWDRIAEYTGEDLTGWLLASPGALVAKLIGQRVATFRVPTIVPEVVDGNCRFRFSDGLCSIHEVAPFGCSHFDTHMDATEGGERSRAALLAIWASEVYQGRWQLLWDAGRRSAPPEVKREALRR